MSDSSISNPQTSGAIKSPRRKAIAFRLDVAALWLAIRKRWLIMLFLGGLLSAGFAAAAVMLLLIAAPKFTASSVLEISPQAPSIVAPAGDNREFTSYRQMQANLLKHRRVLAAALEHGDVRESPTLRTAPDPLAWLEEKIQVDFKLGREYLRISLDGDDGEDAKRIVKGVTESFMEEVVLKDKNRKLQQLDALRNLSTTYNEKLANRYRTLKEIAATGGSANERVSALRQEIAQENLNQAQRELIQLHSEIRRLTIDSSGSGSGPAKGRMSALADPPEYMVKMELEADSEIAHERQALAEREAQLQQYKEALAPGLMTPKLEELVNTVKEQRSRVSQIPQSARLRAIEKARSKFLIRMETAAATTHDRLDVSKRLESELKGEVELLASNVQKLGANHHDLEQLRREVGQIEKMSEVLASNIENLEIEKNAPQRVTLFQEPMISVRPESRKLKYIALAALMGFLLPAVPLLWLELRKRRVVNKDQIAALLGLNVCGTIPYIPRHRRSSAGSNGVTSAIVRARVTESIDSTRNLVLHRLEETGRRTVMVTSAMAGEGKSSVSGHIALSFARAGFRTLIVDADLRRPSLHRVFNGKRVPGLSEILREEATLEDAVCPTPLANLSLLPAGAWTPSASAAIGSGIWRTTLEETRDAFDVVIVDSPPVLMVADTLSLGKEVDATLFTALQDVTELDLLNDAIGMLADIGIEPIGVVVSGVKHRMYSSKYYDRYAQAYYKSQN